MSDSPRRGARAWVVDLVGGKSREEAELGLFGSSIFGDLGWVRFAGLRAVAGEWGDSWFVGVGKAADLKTEIRATGLRGSRAGKLVI